MTDEELVLEHALLVAGLHAADLSSKNQLTLDEKRDLIPGYKGLHSVIVIALNKALPKCPDDIYRRTLAILCGYNPETFKSSWQLKTRAASTLVNFFYLDTFSWDMREEPIDWPNVHLTDTAVQLIQHCFRQATQQLAAEAEVIP